MVAVGGSGPGRSHSQPASQLVIQLAIPSVRKLLWTLNAVCYRGFRIGQRALESACRFISGIRVLALGESGQDRRPNDIVKPGIAWGMIARVGVL